MTDQSRLKEIFVPAGLVLAIFLVSLVFPLMGVVMGMISPTPLIYVYLQRGRSAGLATIGVVFLTILLLMGVKPALIFFAEYAVLATIMAESIRLRVPIGNCVLLSAISSAALSGFLLFLFFADKEMSLADLFQQQIRGNLEQSIETLKGMGKSQAELDTMKGLVEKTAQTFAATYPAFLAVGSLICAVVNFNLVRFLLIRLSRATPDFMGKFSGWVLPDPFIWLFIFSAGSFFLPQNEIQVVGLNLFILTIAVYFLQGLAIVVHILEAKAIPLFLWFVVFILVMTQPLIMGIVAGMGLFDLWVDFRKIKSPKPDTDDRDDEE